VNVGEAKEEETSDMDERRTDDKEIRRGMGVADPRRMNTDRNPFPPLPILRPSFSDPRSPSWHPRPVYLNLETKRPSVRG
jgi:hypothetical protein